MDPKVSNIKSSRGSQEMKIISKEDFQDFITALIRDDSLNVI
jgi:hypothetical protein